MRSEYKRDMNHNYLILYGEDEINTDSYQVRMLVGNVVPSILKCRIQGMDGKFRVYFDITSKQVLSALYEQRKMTIEDLRLIFGGFVKAMEDAAEYLLNPGQFIMSPEYIYMDVEKEQIYFCMMPGYEKDIKEQFQNLTEYILPKIDHEDGQAVILGYGVYKRAMEDSFHLEQIKEELYKNQEWTADIKKTGKAEDLENREKEQENFYESEDLAADEDVSDNFVRDEATTDSPGILKRSCVIVLAFILLCAITAATLLGYLPYMETGAVFGFVIVSAGCTMVLMHVIKKKKSSGALQSQKLKENKEKHQKTQWKASESDIPEQEIQRNRMSESVTSEEHLCKSENISKNADQKISEKLLQKQIYPDYGETTVLSAGAVSGPASLVSREPGELAPIYLNEDLTVIGKMENACDAVISLPTVSRIHAKIRKREDDYYLTDMNSRNGTVVNGRLLLPDEEYRLEPEDEVDFAQARYIFLA